MLTLSDMRFAAKTEAATTSQEQTELDIQLAADLARGNSKVQAKYKIAYKERAAAKKRTTGVAKKVEARSCGDWLAMELAKRTVSQDKAAQLRVGDFEAILDENGVPHRHWNRTTPGWQGRLRMSGRLALQRVVAETGELKLPNEEALKAPKAFVAKHGGQ